MVSLTDEDIEKSLEEEEPKVPEEPNLASEPLGEEFVAEPH